MFPTASDVPVDSLWVRKVGGHVVRVIWADKRWVEYYRVGVPAITTLVKRRYFIRRHIIQ
jgi:hypothetical protein